MLLAVLLLFAVLISIAYSARKIIIQSRKEDRLTEIKTTEKDNEIREAREVLNKKVEELQIELNALAGRKRAR